MSIVRVKNLIDKESDHSEYYKVLVTDAKTGKVMTNHVTTSFILFSKTLNKKNDKKKSSQTSALYSGNLSQLTALLDMINDVVGGMIQSKFTKEEEFIGNQKGIIN